MRVLRAEQQMIAGIDVMEKTESGVQTRLLVGFTESES